MFFNKFLQTFILTLLVLNAACFKATHKSADQMNDQDSATFFVDEVSGSSQTVTTSKEWLLPEAKEFTFKVCAKDLHTQESIRGHKFTILDKDTRLVTEGRTNSDGCLTWAEKIRYNYLADAKFIPLTRFIKADGVHTGAKRLKLAINPWKDRVKSSVEKEVIDLSRQTLAVHQMVQEQEAGLYLMGEKKSITKGRRLFASGIILNRSSIGAASTKNNTRLKVALIPQVVVNDVNGNLVPVPLARGKFTVTMHLVAVIGEGSSEKRVVLGSATSAPHQMLGDRFSAEADMAQTYQSSMGRIELALELRPVDGPADLLPYEAVYSLGGYKQFAGFFDKAITETDLKHFETTNILQEYLKTTEKPDHKNQISGVYAVLPFEFSYLDMPFAEIKLTKETPTSRTISILMQTTVTNPMESNDIIRNTEFDIIAIDGKKIESRSTNQQGILSWRNTLTYKTFAPPHYLEQNVTIKHKTGFEQTFTLRINPWAQFGYALGYDVRRADRDSQEELLVDQQNLTKPQILMGKYVLALNENIQYHIDNVSLNTSPVKSYIINLAPKLLTYSHPINGLESSADFRDGPYLLKVGIKSIIGVDQKTKQPLQKYITTVKKIVRVRNGQINDDISVSFPDLRQMRIRNALFIELHPVDINKLTPFMLAVKGREGFQQIKDKLQGFQIANDSEKVDLKDGSEILRKIENTYKNLDDLIDKDSGVEARTFMGVFTPFSNKGEGPLRPTDDMDETFVKNPESFIKFLSEDKNFRPFNNTKEAIEFFSRYKLEAHPEVTAAALEIEEAEMKKEIQRQTQEMMGLDKFVEHANAEFISLNNEGDVVEKYYPKLKINNKTISTQNAKDDFINKLNSQNYILGGFVNENYKDTGAEKEKGILGLKTRPFEVTINDLKELLPDLESKPGMVGKIKPIRKPVAARLCHFWSHVLFRPYVASNLVTFDDKNDFFFKKCLADIYAGKADDVFALDQKLRTFNTTTSDMLNGYYSRIGISSDYRVSFGHSNSQSSSWSMSPMGLLNPFEALKFVANLSGLNYSLHNRAESFDASTGKSSGLGASSSISSEEARFDLKINSYERCAIVRMQPDFLNSVELAQKFNFPGSIQERARILSRGVMICSGELETKPVTVSESVFYFTPDPFDGSLLDVTDSRNYPWVLQFRGKRDYGQILNLLKADGISSAVSNYDSLKTSQMKNISSLWKEESESIFDFDAIKNKFSKKSKIDANQRPIDFVDDSIKDFRHSAGGIVTTYPGVYTIPQ